MKTNLIIVLAIVAVLILGGGVYLLTKSSQSVPNNFIVNTSNPSGNQPASSGSAGSSSSHSIEINNFAFSPQTLVINVGDTVTWTNSDPVSHTVTSDSGSELSSSHLNNGQTYTHTFTAAGSYPYHCSIHSTMKGTIVVQ